MKVGKYKIGVYICPYDSKAFETPKEIIADNSDNKTHQETPEGYPLPSRPLHSPGKIPFETQVMELENYTPSENMQNEPNPVIGVHP
jgi:hypothetical protein